MTSMMTSIKNLQVTPLQPLAAVPYFLSSPVLDKLQVGMTKLLSFLPELSRLGAGWFHITNELFELLHHWVEHLMPKMYQLAGTISQFAYLSIHKYAELKTVVNKQTMQDFGKDDSFPIALHDLEGQAQQAQAMTSICWDELREMAARLKAVGAKCSAKQKAKQELPLSRLFIRARSQRELSLHQSKSAFSPLEQINPLIQSLAFQILTITPLLQQQQKWWKNLITEVQTLLTMQWRTLTRTQMKQLPLVLEEAAIEWLFVAEQADALAVTFAPPPRPHSHPFKPDVATPSTK